MTKRTVGVSPKVLLPWVVGTVVGTALVIVGVVARDHWLEVVGVTIITAALGHAGIGAAASPGRVVTSDQRRARHPDIPE